LCSIIRIHVSANIADIGALLNENNFVPLLFLELALFDNTHTKKTESANFTYSGKRNKITKLFKDTQIKIAFERGT
jgi:hypothetical protein